ncbi:MAG: SDR family oxidoreductase [Capsulimonadaceae bacterium]|nr:SDR family oxidoreductase [Capsulimonadaceae bacterium]
MDKVVLITGASSGIGAATARALVKAGAQVALVARNVHKLTALAADLGPAAVALPGDVTVQRDIDFAAREAIARYGRVDAVFANAGQFAFDDQITGDPDEWAAMVDVNVNGVMRTVRAVLPAMVERRTGQIVLTASIAGRATYSNSAVYAGTKHFLYGWAVGLRKQVAPHGIGVSVISPGMVLNELWGEEPGSEKQRAEVEARTALTSEDIADAVVYVVGRPPNVNIADMLVLATRQEVPDY